MGFFIIYCILKDSKRSERREYMERKSSGDDLVNGGEITQGAAGCSDCSNRILPRSKNKNPINDGVFLLFAVSVRFRLRIHPWTHNASRRHEKAFAAQRCKRGLFFKI